MAKGSVKMRFGMFRHYWKRRREVIIDVVKIKERGFILSVECYDSQIGQWLDHTVPKTDLM